MVTYPLLIPFVNSLDPDQDRQNVCLYLDPNHFDTLIVFLKELKKKKISRLQKKIMNNFPACRVLFFLKTSAYWVILYAFLPPADFFKNSLFEKLFLKYHQSVEQLGSRSSLTKYLDPNCLQLLSADDTSR